MIKLIPEGWYHASIIQSYVQDNVLLLVWCIDIGQHSYKYVIDRFTLNKFGMTKLRDMTDSIKFNLMEDYSLGELFWDQFLYPKLRASIHVESAKVGEYGVKNIIIEYKIPLEQEEFDVSKPITDQFFYDHKKEIPKRQIAIRKDYESNKELSDDK